MKNSILLSGILFTLLCTSCKKESHPGIIGQWVNSAAYTDPAQGGTGWEPVTRWQELATFSTDAHFSFSMENLGSKGIYQYDKASRDLLLQYIDNDGNHVSSESRKVEELTDDKLVVVTNVGSGQLRKLQYSRIR